ncbi:putative transcriptional histone corepressor [Phaeomoniella chlamydospora]|uniref:Histone transcription regulator 3 homolog n=1 Tax=Phaeomoniella chlamydospora TaxID=158046 RepID=A0A0G2GLC5_PHACM|nr:putative transcriptional histone corepressor [Phaeomoniella chlamydospora]
MSAWTALNLEPEDHLGQEVDDSREIQIEEALKLYQNALKLHSQGPSYATEAAEAYEILFQSEIFRYPEAASESSRDDVGANDDTTLGSVNDSAPLIAATSVDGSPNSLLQIIYLSYKNYGQFLLETLRHQIPPTADSVVNEIPKPKIVEAGTRALQQFAQALERDDSDLDLWRRAARVGGVLFSHRLIRFCLESVLVTDEENSYGPADLLGLDELSAFEDLKNELRIIADDLSASQAPRVKPKQSILLALKRRLDPYPFLPAPKMDLSYEDDCERPSYFVPQRRTIHSLAKTWTAVGVAIYQNVLEFQNGDAHHQSAVYIETPPGKDTHVSSDTEEMSVDLGEIPQMGAKEAVHKEPNPVQKENIMGGHEAVGPIASIDASADHISRGTQDHVDDQLAAQLNNGIAETLQKAEEHDGPLEGNTATLPSRKRSSVTAGNEDPTESGRIKSKRLRARESIADAVLQEEDNAVDQAKFHEEQLIELSQADDIAFTAAEQMLDILQIYELSHLRRFRDVQAKAPEEEGQQSSNCGPLVTAMLDLQAALSSWTDEKTQTVLVGDGMTDLDSVGSSRDVGLALFQEHTRPSIPQATMTDNFSEEDGLHRFLDKINTDWTHPHLSALYWLEHLLSPHSTLNSSRRRDTMNSVSSYTRTQWPSALKELVVKLLLTEDEFLVGNMRDRLDELDARILHQPNTGLFRLSDKELANTHMAESIFELHLDIYSAITNPSSEVDETTRLKQRDSLHRWSDVASGFLNYYAQQDNVELTDDLPLRFLYAATLHAIKTEDVSQDHIMLCFRDLQRILEKTDKNAIYVPNNAAMPEVSVSAISQEMSRISTLDFFMAMFNSKDSDPVAIIESLEPILEYSVSASSVAGETAPAVLSHQARELLSFFAQGDASLTLFLWRRLRDAYKSIDYPPKIVSCYLRSLQVVMKDLLSLAHKETDDGQRQSRLLKWLKYVDDLMVKLMSLVLNSPNAFECIDTSHLRDSLTSVSQLALVLHAFALYDDGIRIGQHQGPSLKSASSNRAFEKVKDKFREMSMRLWTLLYYLLRDGMAQNKDLFPNELEDRANYLRFVHNAMGLRGYCKFANKIFVKLVKKEFLAMESWQDCETDFAQVLFDLYALKFGYGIGDFDHGCTSETLDKKTANQIIPFVMAQVRRVNIKDLMRSDLKSTLEKMQQVMGSYKTSPPLSFNKRVINQYLRSPINPTELYKCLKGTGDIPTKPVKTDSTIIAETGWYFFQGLLALTRFKSVKRVNPTSTDDLDVATTFFRQDLDHDIERWETWYRLAQVYDLKIEDDLLWTAEKINNHRGELATLQRNAIHCYTMAVAASLRAEDVNQETAATMSDMYTEFAIRLYASSREPLSMHAFSLESHDRHFSDADSGTMYKAKPFGEMKIYAVWNLAAHFLRRAIVDKPKKWINYYYLSKCMWKMLCNTGDIRTIHTKPGVEELLEVLVEAVENLPEKKDNRADPILEPHFKLVSIVHKLVRKRMLDLYRASEVLQASKWARKAHLAEEEDAWDPYVLSILKFLGQADKANWHHRVAARAAHVIYDDNEKDLAAALGAKHELTQQIFTKTMTLQVWKPENERAGRHFVYTTRYVSFFIGVLYQLNDRPNLDMLARRIRRKPGDYLNHGKLWDAICTTYVLLLRKIGKLQQGHDEIVFRSMNSDEFAKKAEKVEQWALDHETSSSIIETLKDALELKKLNNSLMKGTALDDLIADAYTKIYETYYREHPEVENQPTDKSIPISSTNTTSAMTNGTNGTSLSQVDGVAESTSFGTPPNATQSLSVGQPSVARGTTPQPPNESNAPQKPTRIKLVSRRDIIRKAEALISKAPASQPSTSARPSSSTPGKALRPVVEIRASSGPSSSTSTQQNALATEDIPPTRLKKESPMDGEPSLGPMSLKQQDPDQDNNQNENDADDESAGIADTGSELSDLDEEESKELERKANILFPGLMAVRNRKDSHSSNVSGGDRIGNKDVIDGDEDDDAASAEDEDEEGGQENDQDADDQENNEADANEDDDEEEGSLGGDGAEDDEVPESQDQKDGDDDDDNDDGKDRDEVMADVEDVLLA